MADEYDCGCGNPTGSDSTRREFIQSAAAGVGMAAVLAAGAVPAPAGALPATEQDICGNLYQLCLRNNCDPETSLPRKWLCEFQCGAERARCIAQQILQNLGNAFNQALQWMRDNPHLVALGAVIIIAGVAFIFVAGPGGAVVLAFA